MDARTEAYMAVHSDMSGSQTQCNEDRSYDRFDDPESLPVFDLHSLVEGRTKEDGKDEKDEKDEDYVDRTLGDDDTGAVQFSSHSAGLYSESTAGSDMDQPGSVGRSHYFAAASDDVAGATQPTAPGTAARPAVPETPCVSRSKNPFASKFQTPLLAGSQLFAQTPFSAGLPLGSPTSSRPSPGGFGLPEDGDTPQGPVSSSLKPRFPTSNLGEGETPLRLLPFAASSEPGSDDVPTQIATEATVSKTDKTTEVTPRPFVVPLSSPLRSKRRPQPRPRASYESMRESQTKREAMAAAATEQRGGSSSDDEVVDVDDDDDDVAQKRRRLARHKREEGAKALSGISMSRSSFREDAVEVPASAGREARPDNSQDLDDMDFPRSARRRRRVVRGARTVQPSSLPSLPSPPSKPSLPDAIPETSPPRRLPTQDDATQSPEPVAAADSPSSPPAMPPAFSTRAWTRQAQGGGRSHRSASTVSSLSPMPSLRSREATPATANESDLSAGKEKAATTTTTTTPVRPSRASRKSSRTTLRQTSRQPSAAAAGPRIFAGMAFAISFQARRPQESDRECAERTRQAEELQRQIEEAGGQILTRGFDELFGAEEEDEDETNEPRLLPAAAATGFTALLADGHSRKAKYMQALALGLPCLSARWATTCLARGVVVDWAPYLLCAGQSAFLGDALRSRTGRSLAEAYDASTAVLADVVEQRPRLLQDVSILVVAASARRKSGSSNSSSASSSTYVFLAQVLGARLAWTHSLEEAREQLLAREDAGRPVDWLYEDHHGKGQHDIYENLVTACAQGGKKRKRPSGSRSTLSVRMPQHVHTLSNERVVQSLILGRLIEADEMVV